MMRRNGQTTSLAPATSTAAALKCGWWWLGFSALAVAAPPPVTQREIGQLFERLEQSGCRFQRNGSWYDAQAASQHLHKKYQYLLDRDRITSTESFIEQGASTSSSSGQPYQVQCAQVAPVDSSVWFRQELGKLRAK